ncbi:MAG: hypothetical protein R3Y19_02870 [Rikenellaceae bacterium]
MKPEKLIALLEGEAHIAEVLSSTAHTLSLEGVSGSLMPLLAALGARRSGGVHFFLSEDRDSAAYAYNDIYNILSLFGLSDDRLFLIPSSYKRSLAAGKEEASRVAQRTAALGAISSFLSEGVDTTMPIILCTYPEALIEKVTSRSQLIENTLSVHQGERVDRDFIEQTLRLYEFRKVEFVGEPGEYATRGGIIDLFSFASNKPYRIELFGNEIDSIRTFSVSTQLSEQKLDRIEIIPNLGSSIAEQRVSLIEYIGEGATMWLSGGNNTLSKIDSLGQNC